MISVPEDWDFTVSGLTVICGTGRDAVRSSLRELEACGYLTRVQRHNGAGHFSRNEYIVTDEPVAPTVEGETPLSGCPSTVDPLTDNPTQQNKDYNNTAGYFISYTRDWRQPRRWSERWGAAKAVYGLTPELVERSCLPHCKLDVYMQGGTGPARHPVAYLRLYQERPNVEHVLVHGLPSGLRMSTPPASPPRRAILSGASRRWRS